MVKFRNYVKDLFDFRKPIKTIKRKLVLTGTTLVLSIAYHQLLTNLSIITQPKIPEMTDNLFLIIRANLFLFIRIVVMAPVFEGLLFWGILWLVTQRVLRRYKERDKKNEFLKLCWIPVITIGTMFGLIHLPHTGSLLHAMSVQGVLGILWGWLLIKTRSLWPNILSHALWNLYAIVYAIVLVLHAPT